MKEPITPHYHIERQLRILWMRSRERSAALSRDKYSCVRCGKKKSTAKGKEQKIEVHHKKGEINWKEIVAIIREKLLCSIDNLECLCPECHNKEKSLTTINNNSELEKINLSKGLRTPQKIP